MLPNLSMAASSASNAGRAVAAPSAPRSVQLGWMSTFIFMQISSY
jgi:hypothetical protein